MRAVGHHEERFVAPDEVHPVSMLERRYENLLNGIEDMVLRLHWSCRETSDRVRDARLQGRADGMVDAMDAIHADCESSGCDGKGCQHQRMKLKVLDKLFEAVSK